MKRSLARILRLRPHVDTSQSRSLGLTRWSGVAALLLVLLMMNVAQAAGLGVTGDGFLNSFRSWIPGILYLAMLVGIVVWLQASSDYNQAVLAGSVSLGTRGLIGGGALTIMTAMGFTQGALLF
jgi:hypothetical protein